MPSARKGGTMWMLIAANEGSISRISGCSAAWSVVACFSVNSSLCSSSTLGTEDDIFTKHGYKIVHKMCDTMQGEMFKAKHAEYHRHSCTVAIKKVDRSLCANRTALEDGFQICVNEDVIKEAVILKHLTCDLSPVGGLHRALRGSVPFRDSLLFSDRVRREHEPA